jgi:RimJ/RimL family protein N-acetyltransferase
MREKNKMLLKDRHYEEIYPRPLSDEPVVISSPVIAPEYVDIVGEYVSLEPQNAERHGDELFNASHNSSKALAIWDYLTYGPWPDVESYKTVLRTQSESFDPIFYAIRSHKTGCVCGQISFLDIQPQNGVIEIGHIWFSPDFQRTEGATEALYLALNYAMSVLGYRRMQWRCNALNKKSRAAAKRLGFRFEGIFYNHMTFKGQNRDTAWYSILDDEWPEVKNNISTWLKPENFDQNGEPRTSLSEVMEVRMPSIRYIEQGY